MIFYSLLAVIFLSPLPYGANRPWSWSLCALLVALLSIAWAIQVFIKKSAAPVFQPIKAIGDIIVLFFIILGWMWIQSSFNGFADLYHPLWQLQNESLNTSSGFISLNPVDTLTSMMRYVSYALVFWLSLCYCQNVAKARQIFYGLMIVGFMYSLYGLLIQLGDIKMILWQERPDINSVSSTFINRNNFATFSGLILLCTLALVYEGVSVSSKYNIGGNIGLQRFMENLIIRTWFPLLVFVVIGTALILTHSRGGFFSSLLGLMVLLIALNTNKHSRNLYMLWVFSAFIIVGGVIFYVSSEGLLARLNAQGLTDPFRDKVYELTWIAIVTNPWMGFGFGSFEEAFTLYKSLDIAGTVKNPLLWDYAHNTYLETIFELGFPAAIALFYCFFKMAWICLKGIFIRRKDWIYSATGLAATCLIAAHAFVDFSMQIPAVVYTYCLLMGAACAQSFSTAKKPTAD